ncbi:MAG TPA: hypothetical protein VN032_07915 [Thermoanaerobaculia bacterium]|jgi:hypothetical protein|nr:hypothetical protein [Thermoanaerobaculia bacterium]
MKTGFAAAGALVFAASVSPLAAQFMPQPSPVPIPPGVTPIARQKLHDPNAEQEASQIPTPGGLPDRRPARPAAARPSDADGSSVDAILAALYASVSHEAAGTPNWERMRGIFLQVGMLIPPKTPRSDMFTVLDVDMFEQRVRESTAAAKAKGEPTSFFEREIARRTDCYGNVCQVFSTYESRRATTDEKPFVRGINSIQLVNDGVRWWIASVAWDTERADNPIPAQYLPKEPVVVPPEYLKKN